MYSFLDGVEEDELRRLIGTRCPEWLRKELEKKSRKKLYSVLFALFGYGLLYESRARLVLLLTLPIEELNSLSATHGQTTGGKAYDLALGLSNQSWRIGGWLPRKMAELFLIPNSFLPTRNRLSPAIEIVHPTSILPPLFDYQLEIAEELNRFFKDDRARACLVQLPTGSGKTRTVVEALAREYNSLETVDRNTDILWLAHTEELCEQALESLRRVWEQSGHYELRIGRFWGDHKFTPEEFFGGVIFASFQKTYSIFKRNPKQFRSYFHNVRYVVVDEAHKVLAPSMKACLDGLFSLGITKLVGLTATPGRGVVADEENKKLARMFEFRHIYSLTLGNDPVRTLQERGILSRISRVVSHDGIECSLTEHEKKSVDFGEEFPSSILKRLAQNERRNRIIISLVLREMNQGNPTLIFACSVDHARELAVALAMEGCRAASVDYKMRRGMRSRVIEEFRENHINALLNYGVLSTGFDAPNIKTIIITRPTTSIVLYSQMIGRGLRGRQVGGTEEINLIDIRDNFINFGGVSEVYSYFNEWWS